MKTQKIIRVLSIVFISFSALVLLSVSIMAFQNPQAVMDMVQVKLPNTDAFSSIRGVYGGVGLTIFLLLAYLIKTNVRLGLGFLTVLWGCYALSRTITLFAEGPLGDFGSQWLVTETVLCLMAGTLFIFNRQANRTDN